MILPKNLHRQLSAAFPGLDTGMPAVIPCGIKKHRETGADGNSWGEDGKRGVFVEQQKVFTTAMLGFDKKAVLDYIYELDCTAKKKDEEQQRRTEEYERQLEQLRQELEESESQRQELEQQHLQAQEELEELKEICQRLREQNGRQEQELRHREKEIQIQAEQNRQLQNKNAEQESKLRILAAEIQLNRQQAEKRRAAGKGQAEEQLHQQKKEEKTGPQPQGDVAQLKDELEEFRRHISQTLAGFEESLNQLNNETPPRKSGTQFFR